MIQIETKGQAVHGDHAAPCRNMQPSSIPYESFFSLHIIILILLSILLISLSTAAAAGRDTITPAQPLADNETLVSPDGSFALGFFSPSAASRYVGIWYNKIPSRDVVWVANRANPVIDSAGQLSVGANGTLVITDQRSNVVWSAAGDRTGAANPVAQLLDTGNFVVKGDGSDNATYAWQGFDYPTDTLLPGMKLGVDRTTGLNRTLRAWKSKTDPSPGEFYAAVDIRGDPEVYLWAGSTRQWRSGPSVGIGLSSIPDRGGGFSVRFVNDDREATYSQVVTDNDGSIVSRVVVNQSGLIQHWLWSREASRWNVSWHAPSRDKCDAVGVCGAYAVCDAADGSPKLCQCLQGFVPSNWGGGCVRSTNLSCTIGTTDDGFATVGGVKLPVSANAVADASLGPEECEAKCLKNCSCTAYASASSSSVDGKEGCVTWVNQLLDISKVSSSAAGQDLHVRLSAAYLASRNGRSLWSRISWPLALVAMYIALVSFTVFFTCVVRRYWSRRKRRRRELQHSNSFLNEQSDEGANDFDLPIMDFATIEAATENFSSMNKLGQGGYGPVYKGILGDSREIAVKRLAKTSLQGSEEFKNEVILIAKLQNRNLVQLLGCCIERKERMLIYEYMVNKSLDAFLFEKQILPLDWQTRYRIILGITRGLLYLHHDSRLRIIHRDLKASNILLDKDMNPKISDFGMARILAGDETDINTKKVVGTFGYMSPEYALDGIFSLKSDVYSFGVLVLEIISGKKNRGSSPFSPQLNLVSHAWNLWIERKGLELVDESLNYTVAVNEVLNCIKVGLLCVQERPEDRPLMSSVILMLGSDIATLPEPKQPGFVTRLSPPEVDECVDKHILYASNNLTASLTGR